MHQKDNNGYTIYHSDGSTKEVLPEHTPIIDRLAADNSDESINNFYNPNHIPSNTVKIQKNGTIKDYDVRSQEYKDLYNSGHLASYDAKTDTYYATPLKEFTVTAERPQWAKDKIALEKQYDKDWYIDNILPKFSRAMGVSSNNMGGNQAGYDKFINDKVAENLLNRKIKLQNDLDGRLQWYNSFSDKEREIINNSVHSDKFEPAMRAYRENQSNEAKKYGIAETFKDTDKLAQSVEGTPERFRFFPNAENNYEDYVNPLIWIGEMAKGLGNVPKDIKEGNNLKAALSVAAPLAGGALGSLGTKTTGQFLKNTFLPLGGAEIDILKGGKNLINNSVELIDMEDAIRMNNMSNNNTSINYNITNSIDNQLPAPPEEINFNISNNNKIDLRRTRNNLNNVLPEQPFTIGSDFPQPISNLMDALQLNDKEFKRLRQVYNDDRNYFLNNNITATPVAIDNFLNSKNARDFENNFLSNINNTNINDLSRLEILNNLDISKYKNLTFNELVIKNPSLAEKIKTKLIKFKENTVKFYKDLDLHAGKIINPKQNINRELLEKDINSLLKKGLDIKKVDIPIQVKSEGSTLKIYLDVEKNGKFLESGYISIPEEGLSQKTLTESLLSLFKKEHKGVQKTLDYPTINVGSNSLFPSNTNVVGIGGELGEAIKQSVKNQNKNWNLLSSKTHSNEGAERYLTEFLNNRKLAIDVSSNPQWLVEAEKVKKLYPNGIKKEEVKKLIKNNPELRPTNVKFAYSLIPIILGANSVIESQQNKNEQ